ncbi:hypothetical protein Q1695_015547 [Nippostrongylus brasiliensis]|nr:hypothetical protein Q1695_015547 [Nippostrongylus brasiliensis]
MAVSLENTDFPVVGIQAAFGKGKTVVATAIAAQQAAQGRRIILTASGGAECQHVPRPPPRNSRNLPIRGRIHRSGRHYHLDAGRSPPRTYGHSRVIRRLSKYEMERCERFRAGRTLLQDHHRAAANPLSATDREELLLAERDVSELVDLVVKTPSLIRRPKTSPSPQRPISPQLEDRETSRIFRIT